MHIYMYIHAYMDIYIYMPVYMFIQTYIYVHVDTDTACNLHKFMWCIHMYGYTYIINYHWHPGPNVPIYTYECRSKCTHIYIEFLYKNSIKIRCRQYISIYLRSHTHQCENPTASTGTCPPTKVQRVCVRVCVRPATKVQRLYTCNTHGKPRLLQHTCNHHICLHENLWRVSNVIQTLFWRCSVHS